MRLTRGELFSLAAVPGIVRPPNYRTAPPIPASEIALALIAVAVLMAFGAIIAIVCNRLGVE